MKPYSIRALRLVGFHNFEDETISVTGDLFVLGVNESGKTTVLDAIQLALSGGQDFEWNAAARIDGRRGEGRSLQGVILRADLSGNAHRQGPAIAYAALELVHEGGGCKTLVYGASVSDMSDAPTVWGTVIDKPLSEITLTRSNSDGSATVLGPDDLESAVGHKVYRSIGHYRSRVAEALFRNRDEYARITKLWQTAKSYKELARASRHMNDLFLQVLPAPDPEPFLKVRKAFSDIQKLRVDLDDLRNEIGLLTSLEAGLEEAQESREAVRRYEYVRDKGAVSTLAARVRELRIEEQSANVEASDLALKATEAKEDAQSIDQEMNLLRATEGFAIAEQITRQENLISTEQKRLDEALETAKNSESAFTQAHKDLQHARELAETAINVARATVTNWQEQSKKDCAELRPLLERLLSTLPAVLSDTLDKNALCKAVGAVQSAFDDVEQRIANESTQASLDQKDCDARSVVLKEEHRRVSESDDLFPDRNDVLDALAALEQRGISVRLLYQEIEFDNAVPMPVRAVLESVLDDDTLFTIVVAPMETPAARAIVLTNGTGVKVLDAVPALSSGSATAKQDSLPSFLRIADERVRAHVSAAFASSTLLANAPDDGDPSSWFLVGGEIGDAAARRRIEAAEPMWIGAEHRGLRRSRRLVELQSQIDLATERVRSLAAEIERNGTTTGFLRVVTREISNAVNIDLLESRWASVVSAVAREVTDSARLESARRVVDRYRASVERYRHELRALKQREGADVVKIRRQYEKLEQRRQQATKVLDDLNTRMGAAGQKARDAASAAAQAQEQLRSSEEALNITRAALLVLPGLTGVDDVDQYVFQRKQGQLIKDPEQKIREATIQEATHLQRLKGGDGVLNPILAPRFGFGVKDSGDLIEITDRSRRPLHALVVERQDQDRDLSRSINERTRTLFEQVLATELVTRLRDYRRSLEVIIGGLNKVLAELRFGDSIFRVHHRPLPESKPLLELLRAQSVLDDANRQQLIDFLANRQGLFETEGDVPQFLDYRHWFDFSLERRESAAEGSTVMGPEAMVRGSGGAQSTHAYLLLFALSALLFDRSEARLRLLIMDEAFPNLDPVRKELLLRCAKQLRLELAIATPDLDGTILGPSRSHTTVLIERDDQHRVAVTPLTFTATPDQAELFTPPRAPAFIGVEMKTP